MNNLAEVFFVRLGIGANYERKRTFHHSIPTFANSNMLTSFDALPLMILQWGNGVMSSP